MDDDANVTAPGNTPESQGNAVGDDGRVPASRTMPAGKGLLEWLDVSAKLLGAFAVIGVAIAANTFQQRMNFYNQENQKEMNLLNQHNQERMTGLTLQNQREQAESQLRAAMFSSLIQPFVGAEKGSPIAIDREELLAQLLLLNFNEDFESKPLLERVDARLAIESPPKWQSARNPEESRDALRAIARRVADRQISSLSWDWKAATSGEHHGCEVYWLSLGSRPMGAADGCNLGGKLGDVFSINSPDAKATLKIVVDRPDWKNQTFFVSVQAQANVPGEDQQHVAGIGYNFTLTWFDLPLTDNTMLPTGDRFAINLRGVRKDIKRVDLRVLWFPPGYFTVRERPGDSRRILRLLLSAPEEQR